MSDEAKIAQRSQSALMEGVQGRRITPPPDWAVEGSVDGVTWERLGGADEAVDMGERWYARFVSVVLAEPEPPPIPEGPRSVQVREGLGGKTTRVVPPQPGIISHRATLRLTRDRKSVV